MSVRLSSLGESPRNVDPSPPSTPTSCNSSSSREVNEKPAKSKLSWGDLSISASSKAWRKRRTLVFRDRPWVENNALKSLFVVGTRIEPPPPNVIRATNQTPEDVVAPGQFMDNSLWEHLFTNSYCSDGVSLFLDRTHTIGTPLKSVDVSIWNRVQHSWKEEVFKKYRHNWIGFFCSGAALTDSFLVEVILHENLRHVDLSNCSLLTDIGICGIGMNCPNLLSANLTGCALLTNAGVQGLTGGCVYLESLVLDQCIGLTDESVYCCVDNCKQLRQVSFKCIPSIKGSGLLSLPSAGQNVMIVLHKFLEEIDFSRCPEINDDSLHWISESLFYLQRAEFENCDKITNTGIAFLASMKLLHLNVSGCVLLNDKAAHSVGKINCLQTLELSRIDGFTPAGLGVILSSCPMLARIELANCRQAIIPEQGGNLLLEMFDNSMSSRLDDLNLHQLSVRAKQLQYVNVSHCNLLTGAGLTSLLEQNKSLRGLDISYCNGLSSFDWVPPCCGLASLNLSGLDFVCDTNLQKIVCPNHTTTLTLNDNRMIRKLDSCCASVTSFNYKNSPNVRLELVKRHCPRLPLPSSNQLMRQLYLSRVELEHRNASIIQKSFRRYMASVWISFQWILLRFRLLTPVAARHMQRLWRQYRIPHHREILRRVIVFQRVIRKRNWIKHIRSHIKTLNHRWGSSTRIQAFYRGFQSRKRNAELVEHLRLLRYRRLFKPIAKTCAVESHAANIFQRSLIDIYFVDESLNRKEPIFEISLILQPVREATTLRKRMLEELLQRVKEIEIRKEQEKLFKRQLLSKMFVVCSSRVQKFIRRVLKNMREEKAKKEKERKMSTGTVLAVEDHVEECIVRVQAKVRGYLARSKPLVLLNSDIVNIPKLADALSKMFDLQRKSLDDTDAFQRQSDFFSLMKTRYRHPTIPVEKVKEEYYSSSLSCYQIRTIISERFIANYLKRWRLHKNTVTQVASQLAFLKTVVKSGDKLENKLRKRLADVERGDDMYRNAVDAKLRQISKTPELVQKTLVIEKKWLEETLETVQPLIDEHHKQLQRFAQDEMRRLRFEHDAQAMILKLHHELDVSFNHEISFRKELLSIMIDISRACDVDHAWHNRLLRQEAYIRDRIQVLHERSSEVCKDFLDYCLKRRVTPTLLSQRRQEKLQKRIKSISRELCVQAWSALVPVDFVKPEEVKRRQLALLESRNRVRNLQLEKEYEDELKNQLEDEKQKEMEQLEELEKEDVDEEADLMDEIFAEAREEALGKKSKSRSQEENTLVTNWFHSERYKARLRLMRSILEKQKESVGFSEAISEIAITVGEKERIAMKRLSNQSRREGNPAFKQVEPNLARAFQTPEPVYLWTKSSIHLRDQVRSLKFQTKAKPERNYDSDEDSDDDDEISQATKAAQRAVALLMGKDAYEAESEYRHKKLENFLIEVDRDGRVDEAIVEIRITCQEKEEESLRRRGFVKINKEIRCKDVKDKVRDKFYLWLLTSDVDKSRKKLSLESLEKQKIELTKLLEENPNNERVKQLLHETDLDILEFEVSKSEKELEMARAFGEGKSVQDSASLLGLSKVELKKFTVYFSTMDTSQEGEISIDQFLYFIGMEASPITEKVFSFFDDSGDGNLDFPEVLHALATFCMFGAEQVIQLAFKLFDQSGKGQMSRTHFREAVKVLHGLDPEDHRDMLRVIKYIEENLGVGMSLDDVLGIHLRYPLVFQPIFEIQTAMMKAFMGEQWWAKRKRDFVRARVMLKQRYEKELKELKKARLKKLKREKGIKTPFETFKSKVATFTDSATKYQAMNFKTIKKFVPLPEKLMGEDESEESDYDQHADESSDEDL